jgi:hypothetical protein
MVPAGVEASGRSAILRASPDALKVAPSGVGLMLRSSSLCTSWHGGRCAARASVCRLGCSSGVALWLGWALIDLGLYILSCPYKLIGFGAMAVTNPYKLIGFGAMDVTKTYKFIVFGAYILSCPYSIVRA